MNHHTSLATGSLGYFAPHLYVPYGLLFMCAVATSVGCNKEPEVDKQQAVRSIAPVAAATQAAFTAKPTITAPWTKIVRGVNGEKCDAKQIGDGNNPKVSPQEDLTDLSVSCSDDKTVSIGALRAPLKNAHACESDLGKLRKARKDVTIVRDPIADNKYHCLLSTITPSQFVSQASWKQ